VAVSSHRAPRHPSHPKTPATSAKHDVQLRVPAKRAWSKGQHAGQPRQAPNDFGRTSICELLKEDDRSLRTWNDARPLKL